MEEKVRRKTRQRQVILEELQKVTSHPTTAELYEIVRGRLPKISLGTVYRNLELLAQKNMIKKLKLSGKEVRYDGIVRDHYHIRCSRCGRVDDFHDAPAYPMEDKFETTDGWEIQSHRLEFVGICPACKREQSEQEETAN